MWGREIRLSPSDLAPVEIGRTHHLLGGNQALQCSQPMVVIMRAVVYLTPVSDLPQHRGKRRGPFVPGETSPLMQAHSQRESLGLPGFLEDRTFLVPRQALIRRKTGEGTELTQDNP